MFPIKSSKSLENIEEYFLSSIYGSKTKYNMNVITTSTRFKGLIQIFVLTLKYIVLATMQFRIWVFSEIHDIVDFSYDLISLETGDTILCC